jgi:hypothetical protein
MSDYGSGERELFPCDVTPVNVFREVPDPDGQQGAECVSGAANERAAPEQPMVPLTVTAKR